MIDQQAAIQIDELQQRNKWLTRSVIGLAVSLGTVSGFLSLAVACLIFLLPVLALAHQRLPGIARSCGRMLALVFGPIRSTKSKTETAGTKRPISDW